MPVHPSKINSPKKELRLLQQLLQRCALAMGLILLALPAAHAASCTTQSMMTQVERDALSNAARTLVTDVQQGNMQALRATTVPAIANHFVSLEATAQNLQPLMAHATITVDDLYRLDAADVTAGAPETDFNCGLPGSLMNVGLSFHNLPAGQYAVAILHATGVPKPQQFTLVLEQVTGGQWELAGFFNRPMTLGGHDGTWFWTHARTYARQNMKWNARLYYQMAERLLRPVNFLSSPNLELLQKEAEAVKAAGLPGAKPIEILSSDGSFTVTSISATDVLGPLDLDVQYSPDAMQAGQLANPVMSRKQVTAAMVALLAQHPELRAAFHGIWMQAEQGGSSTYALELPMNQIQPNSKAQ